MKNFSVQVATINVISCEPKMDRNTPTVQERDNDGNLLWQVKVKEELWDDELNDYLRAKNAYKSFVELEKGDHLVRVKSSHIGESKGSFTAVNSYYKIIGVLDKTTKVTDLFTPAQKGAVPPTKKKIVEQRAMQ